MQENDVDITCILALILSRIGISDFSEIQNDIDLRKRIQKSIYILQLDKFKFDIGYQYNLYLAGPYSPQLSNDYYDIADESTMYSNMVKHLKFKKDAEKKLKQFIDKFDEDYDLLECFATLHFLITYTYSYLDEEQRVDDAKKHLFKIKPGFKDNSETVDAAVNLLSEIK